MKVILRHQLLSVCEIWPDDGKESVTFFSVSNFVPFILYIAYSLQ